MSLADPHAAHPIRLPDGSAHRGTVHLSAVLDHPNIEVGAFSYYLDFDPPSDAAGWAFRIAPYLFPNSREMLRIGKFCQFAHGTRFITARANHPPRRRTVVELGRRLLHPDLPITPHNPASGTNSSIVRPKPDNACGVNG